VRRRGRCVIPLLALVTLLAACGSGAGGARSAATTTPTPSAPASVNFGELRAAFTALLNQAVEAPTPAELLNAAWDGLIGEAQKEHLDTAGAARPAFGADPAADLQALSQAFQPVVTRSHTTPNATSLNYAAIDAMANSLNDSHTTFLPPTSFQQFNRREAGDLGTSVGFRIQRTTSPPPEILEVVAGSAAQAAGVHAGDTLLSLNGRAIQSYTLQELSRTLEGPDGSKLAVGIRRGGSARLQELTIVRQTIPLDIVQSRVLPGNVGYLRIREFPNQNFVLLQVNQALSDFADAQVRGIIVDLRGNPGGSVPVLQAVASRFISQNPLAYTVNRAGVVSTTDRTGAFNLGIPYTALVDDGSASSAELFAAAAQEYHDGLIVGERTCGCLMEAIETGLPASQAGLEIAVARVLTPVTHMQIEKHPIVPDEVVPPDPRLLEQGRDPQLEAALRSLGVDAGTASQVTYGVSQGTVPPPGTPTP
jgi:carboxyl-terminal processing protease